MDAVRYYIVFLPFRHNADAADAAAAPCGPYRVGTSFGVVLDVIALELDELIESEFAKGDSAARVLPTGPSKILTEFT